MLTTTLGFSHGKAAITAFLCFTLIGAPSSLSGNPTEVLFPRMAITPVPVGEEPGVEETEAFRIVVESLRDWREEDGLVEALAWLQLNPNSPWAPALRANLGMIYSQSGSFTRAIEEWKAAWEATKDAPQGTHEYHFANRVASELSALYSRLGRVPELAGVLAEFESRPVEGVASRRLESARAAMASMVLRPEGAFKCGPYALQTILRHSTEQTPAQAELIAETDSTPQGFSLYEVYMLSEELGMNLQMAFRQPGAELPLPAVAHWRSNHFAAVIAEDDEGWVVDDPTFQRRIHFSEAALDDEASGYFLISAGELPEGWRGVAQVEAEEVFGRGAPDDTSEEDECPGDSETGGDCNGGKGMPGYSFSTFHAALIVRDTPIVQESPVGRSIPFTITYNHRSNEDDSHAVGGLLGSKWTHNWRVYLEEETSGSVSSWRLRTASNRTELYETDGTASAHHHISQAQLVPASGSSSFPSRQLANGAMQIFGHEVEIIGGPDLYFLTESIDPQGNSILLHYDGQDRLIAIEDALGREITLEYDDTPVSGDPEAIYRIRSVVLEDEREAAFGYSDGMLNSVTDMAGMTSNFSYQDDAQSDFITEMETPYGVTEFERLEYEGYFSGPGYQGLMVLRHGVEATNPLGQKERIEFSFDFFWAVGYDGWRFTLEEAEMSYQEIDDFIDQHWILNSIPTSEIPTYSQMPVNLYYPSEGTTVHWDYKTYKEFPPDPETGENYSKGIQTHWLRDRNNKDVTVPIRSSVKNPLKNRVWYRYEDQLFYYADPLHAGVSAQPIQIGRIIEDDRFESTEMQYNADGRLTHFTDPEGRETEYVYAANGIDLLEVRQKVGSGWVTVLEYENYGNHLPGKRIDGSGNETLYQYNAQGQLTAVTNPLLETTTYVYHNRPIFDPQTEAASGYGYLVAILGPDNQLLQSVGYDASGRPAVIEDSEGRTVAIEYDDLDRRTKVTYPDATFEEWTYERLDVASYRDREGRVTSFLHSPLGQLMVVTDPEGQITQYDYCTCGDIKTITDPAGNSTWWRYDIQGRVTKKIYPDGSEVHYEYDPASGRLASSTDAMGQETLVAYTVGGEVDTLSYANTVHPPPAVAFTYDPEFNRLSSMTDGTGTTAWTYHPFDGQTPGAGQVHTVTGPFTDSTIAYTYDELGRRTGRTIDGAANGESWELDPLGRVPEITNNLGVFEYAYLNDTPQLKEIQYPDGQKTLYSYYGNQQDRRLERIEHQAAGGALIAAHEYSYNPDGIITAWQQQGSGFPDQTWQFGYDEINQLTSAVLKDPQDAILQTLDWTYDPAGNRIGEQIDGGGLVPASHNELNQLTEDGGGPIRFAGSIDEPSQVWVAGHEAQMRNGTDFEAWLELPPGTHQVDITAQDYSENSTIQTFEVHIADEGQITLTYDLNGNLISRISDSTITTYEWDAANRLIAIEVEEETRSEFMYDGFSRRVGITEKEWDSQTENWELVTENLYLWDGLAVAEERSGIDGATVEKRFYPQGVEIVTGTEAGTYTYRTDHLGSIREIVDDQGNLAARFDYSPWGEMESVSGSFDLDFGYTGHFIHQPSGLSLAPFRAYDAGLGRWLSRDPIGVTGGLNLYGYVGNSPLSWIDPFGLRPCSEIRSDIDEAKAEYNSVEKNNDALAKIASGARVFNADGASQNDIDNAIADGAVVIKTRGSAMMGGDSELLSEFENSAWHSTVGFFQHAGSQVWGGLANGFNPIRNWADGELMRNHSYQKFLADRVGELLDELDETDCGG
ncbi:RHS repeat-associated core domain-containing protein [Puniceicoccus vermicola]|uniref:Peptidase C39 domain-containing protein n=1 Tax=Puniceicoccus vermicola TaxID=388746 RepID=A0A7X1B1W5_9BACT|nr:RHS repeat-associated core domain-containing protein [Puniceicoccus vermicola]MBC2604096.1 hypothetical protein [Puniceicoccus vermicola]